MIPLLTTKTASSAPQTAGGGQAALGASQTAADAFVALLMALTEVPSASLPASGSTQPSEPVPSTEGKAGETPAAGADDQEASLPAIQLLLAALAAPSLPTASTVAPGSASPPEREPAGEAVEPTAATTTRGGAGVAQTTGEALLPMSIPQTLDVESVGEADRSTSSNLSAVPTNGDGFARPTLPPAAEGSAKAALRPGRALKSEEQGVVPGGRGETDGRVSKENLTIPGAGSGDAAVLATGSIEQPVVSASRGAAEEARAGILSLNERALDGPHSSDQAKRQEPSAASQTPPGEQPVAGAGGRAGASSEWPSGLLGEHSAARHDLAQTDPDRRRPTDDASRNLTQGTERIEAPPLLRETPSPRGGPESEAAREPLTQTGVERVVSAARLSATHGGVEVRVQLHPESLGEVRVHVRLEGGVLNARLEAASPAARDALEGGAQSLRAALQEQGIQVERLLVGVRVDLGTSSQRQDLGAPPSPPPERAADASLAPSGEPEGELVAAGRLDVRI